VNNFLSTVFAGVGDIERFCASIQKAIDHLAVGGVFVGDNLITFGKNLSFLHDERFMAAWRAHAASPFEQAVIWRTHVLCWAARHGLRRDGDFVECGCYKGTSARILYDYLGLGSSPKRLYLYDLFVHSGDMAHHAMPEHSATLFESVKARFAGLANVEIFKGEVPGTLHGTVPERIAFLHVDMNNAAAEIGALELLFDRVAPGGAVVLDDYGWNGYRRQKDAEDAFFASRGYSVLELPTGQGLVIR
jgi:predicted O-methyltransferase YrrM